MARTVVPGQEATIPAAVTAGRVATRGRIPGRDIPAMMPYVLRGVWKQA